VPFFPAEHFGAGKRAAMHQSSYIRLSMSTLSSGLMVEHPLFIPSKHRRAAPHKRALCSNATCAGLSTEPCRGSSRCLHAGPRTRRLHVELGEALVAVGLEPAGDVLGHVVGAGVLRVRARHLRQVEDGLEAAQQAAASLARARPRCLITDQGGCNTKDVVLLSLAELHWCA